MATFRPGEVGIPTRLATVFGAGYAIVGLSSTFLTLLHILRPATLFVTLAATTVTLWVLGLMRGGPLARLRALGGDVRATPWTLGIGFAFLIGLAIVLSTYSPVVNFGTSNPFRYWADGLEIASGGQVPEGSLQWGTEYPPTVSKLVFNAFNAGVSYAVTEPLGAMGGLTVLCLIAFPVSGWAVGSELGFRYSAPLLAVLFGARVFLGHLMAFSALLFVGESFGLMVATCGLALGLRALRYPGQWRAAILAGVVFAAAAGTHLVPALIMLTLLGWYAIARLLIERDLRRVAGAAAVILGLTGAIAGGNLLLSGGDIGFGGAEGSDRYDTSGGRFDPTVFFVNGDTHQDPGAQPATRIENNGGWYDRPQTVVADYVGKSTRLPSTRLLLYLVPAVIALAGIAAVLWFPKDLKPVGIIAIGFWVMILAVGLLFSLGYDTYIPARFPNRRLFAYGSLSFVLLGTSILEVVLLTLRRVRPWAPVVAATVLIGMAAAVVLPTARVSADQVAEGRQSVSVMNSIRADVPCDARILASQRTAGIFQAITGRAAVTEGMAPFVRPDILTTVIERLLEARRFFRYPKRNKDFLVNEGVDYVVVVKKKYLLDTYPQLLGRADRRALSDSPFLELVERNSLVDLYMVTGLQKAGDFPSPSDFPGYTCGRAPLPHA